jgi:ribosomal protein S18 acetylase RimI-like enzyme
MTKNAYDYIVIRLEPTEESEIDRLEAINQSYVEMLAHNGVPPEIGVVRNGFFAGDLPPLPDASREKFDLFTLKTVDDVCVGFLMDYRGYPQPEVCWISLLVIDRAHRGKGYGSQAIELLIQRLHNSGCTKLGIGVAMNNTEGLRFWTKVGFLKKIRTYSIPEGNPEQNFDFIQLEMDI